MKKFLSTLLTLSMLLSLMPTATWAADETPNNPETIIATQPTLATDSEQDNQPEPGQTPNQEGDLGTDEVTTPTEDTNATTTPELKLETQSQPEQKQESKSEPEPEITVTEITQTITLDIPDADSLPDNDELFETYVNRILYDGLGDSGQMFSQRRPAADKLDDVHRAIYENLKKKIEAVAEAGGSTAFAIIPDGLTVKEDGSVEWTATDLKSVGFTISEDANSAEATANTIANELISINDVVSALLFDCPYELYWYDKTTSSGQVAISFGYTPTDGGALATFTMASAPIINFPVAQSYRATTNDSTVVTSAVSNAATAKKNAEKIVAQNYGDNSVLERLRGYKDAICNRVSYNKSAADNKSTPYGDPWQLINVFDHTDANGKQVVCEGYAKAFQYLCDLTPASAWNGHTVDSFIVSGTMAGGTGAGGHMWNIVQIDEKDSYLVDVTNSDAGSVGQDGQLLFMVGGTPTSGSFDGRNLKYTFGGVSFEYYNGTKEGTANQYAYWDTSILTLSTDERYVEKDPDPTKTLKSIAIKEASAPLNVPKTGEKDVTQQFTVTATYSDDTTADNFTDGVTWSVPEEVKGVKISEKGLLTVTREAATNSFDTNNTLKFNVKATVANLTTPAEVEVTLTREAPRIDKATFYKDGTELTAATDTIVIPDTGNATATYTVNAFDQYGQEMKNVPITGASSDEGITVPATASDSITVTVAANTASGSSVTLTVTDGDFSKALIVTAKKLTIAWPEMKSDVTYTYGDDKGKLFTDLTVTVTPITGNPIIGNATLGNEVLNSENKKFTLTFTTKIDGKDTTFTKEYAISEVKKKDITVKFNPLSVEYGTSLDQIKKSATYTLDSLVNGDQESTLGLEIFLMDGENTISETPTPNESGYIFDAQIAHPDYNITVSTSSGKLTVTKAQVTLADTTAINVDAIFASDETNNASAEALANYVTGKIGTINGTYANGTTPLAVTECRLTSGTWTATGGTYTYTLTLAPAETDKDNFEVKGNATATITVKPVNATLTFANGELTKKASDLKGITDISAVGLPAEVKVTYDDKTTTTNYTLDWSGSLQAT